MSKRESRALQDRLVQDHDTRRPILQYVRHFIVLMKQLTRCVTLMLSCYLLMWSVQTPNPTTSDPFTHRSRCLCGLKVCLLVHVCVCMCVPCWERQSRHVGILMRLTTSHTPFTFLPPLIHSSVRPERDRHLATLLLRSPCMWHMQIWLHMQARVQRCHLESEC